MPQNQGTQQPDSVLKAGELERPQKGRRHA